MAPVESVFDLSGRTALVTGASSGLGVRLAHALAEAGANVVLAARRLDRLREVAADIERAGVGALAVSCDVTEAEQVEAAVASAVGRFGALDVAIANAGSVPEGLALPERVPPALFEESVRVNLLGTWYTAQAAGRQMLAQGGGSIVLMSSVAGLGRLPNFPPAYQVSKAGLDAMTRLLAASWGDRGVRVNALAPAFFPSEMTERILSSPYRARIDAQAPLGRIGNPEELVGPMLLLASDAGSYITGHVLAVDGGMSAAVGHTPYTEELFGVHAAVMPAELGRPIRPAEAPTAGRAA
jgi:NAD(P)-dependent dehydrogenase (short-subunit alcohol dehydrogenase family)